MRVVAWVACIGCIGCPVDDWHAIGYWFDGCSRRNIVLWDGIV